MNMHEALGAGLIEAVALVVGRQVEVVQGFGAAAAVDGDVAAVQHQPDVAGYMLLGIGDKGLQ
ncbi:Uncharacterised protein [Mycobacteroides abscessus subsp. abscessus]|nr:Uncharacterised protein [Mycobacteroides abscessus subsp. abscessus]